MTKATTIEAIRLSIQRTADRKRKDQARLDEDNSALRELYALGVEKGISHREMAEWSGVTREAVSLLLRRPKVQR